MESYASIIIIFYFMLHIKNSDESEFKNAGSD